MRTPRRKTSELEALGYGEDPLDGQLLEAGTKLIAGRFDEIPIPEADAKAWVDLYPQTLARVHAAENAAEVFRYAARPFRLKRADRNADQGHGQRGRNALYARSVSSARTDAGSRIRVRVQPTTSNRTTASRRRRNRTRHSTTGARRSRQTRPSRTSRRRCGNSPRLVHDAKADLQAITFGKGNCRM